MKYLNLIIGKSSELVISCNFLHLDMSKSFLAAWSLPDVVGLSLKPDQPSHVNIASILDTKIRFKTNRGPRLIFKKGPHLHSHECFSNIIIAMILLIHKCFGMFAVQLIAKSYLMKISN